jgi:catechol 2,3-dioxygenase-like lactoylglutathione lyase family enzyme
LDDKFCLGLHHLGYLTADLPAAALHFQRTLGYRLESLVIEDTAQTARVQFLRQPGSTSWLELVTPNGRHSKLTNALRRGDGLHHVCYEVMDLELACARYRERGCMMVGAPTPAQAFSGGRIAWFMDDRRFLFELLEAEPGPLSLASILPPRR